MHDAMKDNVMTMMHCSAMCLKTINHCLELGGEHASKEHINLLMDCAKICELSANFVARGSEFHQELCSLCADICERCAEDCKSMADDDEHMQRCADMCRQCAEQCRDMATA